MKITSLEIKQHEFEKSFRGYNIDEVNDFLSNLAQEWDRMLNESKMLKMQLEIAEKETSKLREVEMTLIKTLRTAEDTSSRITENASTEAAKKITDAELKASEILIDAENKSKLIIEEAEQKSISINTAAKTEYSELESKFELLEAKKVSLLSQIQSIATEVQHIVDNHQYLSAIETTKKTEKLTVNKKTESEIASEETLQTTEHQDDIIELDEVENINVIEDEKEAISFSSAVNELNLEAKNEDSDLEIIEGIGPKIKEVLNTNRIYTFRDLATTPVYRIKDILEAAGSQFAMHDPTSWVDQAKLAEDGNWDKLEQLKEFLIAGRKPANSDFVAPELAKEEIPVKATEEMLDKVNKVKAAIRKAMVEKGEKSETKETKSAKEYVAEKQQGGSFFDNLN